MFQTTSFLAIGKEGQNARLAAKLTGYKIDIKSESQAAELAEELDFGGDFGILMRWKILILKHLQKKQKKHLRF